jgi:8-oxo-dGTP diphosphatase
MSGSVRKCRPGAGENVVSDTWLMPNEFVPPEQYYPQLARVRQGAGALITSPDGRLVMCDVSYRDYLELPGGAVEAGESPPAACARECREELGVDIEVGRLLALDHQLDGGERGDSIMFVYDGGVVEDVVYRAAPTPEGRVVLVAASDLDDVTIPRLANRIRQAIAARERGGVGEAVCGETR